ncbi:M48 family metallopeptidase [Pseudomonadota bacterium]
MADSQHMLDIDGRAVPLRVRRHARARRLILRIDEDGQGAVVTIPKRAAIRDGVDMAKRKIAWIATQLNRQPEQVPFVDGAELPYLGETHTVRHDQTGRGIRLEGDEIIVAGRTEHLSRRLNDWLKARAREEFSTRAHAKAVSLGRNVRRITVRDTKSRWGSCTANGGLNFSWRLVLAPEFVLDYVVAHEVAHLVHRDHGEAFWALTESLCDGMGEHMNEAKAWLNAHGRNLHIYG